ncbi:hypothetical protein C0992_005527 [Termitomyces sp. T32_za158]|nr:hypothetical protein C0992_005527 [Termitomyces sp. T32_za158]
MLTLQLLPITPASQTIPLETPEISSKIQISSSAQPPPNFSGDQSRPVSAQSAARLIQEVPLYLSQFLSRSPDIQVPTPVEARPRLRQDTQHTAGDNRSILFSRPSIQRSTPGNVQFRIQEDVQPHSSEAIQSPVLNSNRAILDRPTSSNPEYFVAEELRSLPQARTVAEGSDGPGSTPLDWIVPVDDKVSV